MPFHCRAYAGLVSASSSKSFPHPPLPPCSFVRHMVVKTWSEEIWERVWRNPGLLLDLLDDKHLDHIVPKVADQHPIPFKLALQCKRTADCY